MLPRTLKDAQVILDTETTGLNKLADRPFMVALRVDDKVYWEKWTPKVAHFLSKELPRAMRVIAHNAKYDYHMLRNGGVDRNSLYDTSWWCTLVTEALINEHTLSFSLDNLGKAHFAMGKNDQPLWDWLAAHCGGPPTKKAQMPNLQKAPIEMVAEYCAHDCMITQLLYSKQVGDVSTEGITEIQALEMQVLPALAELEERGVPTDAQKVQEVRAQLIREYEEAQMGIIKIIGKEVNPRSPNQMSDAFKKCGIPITYLESGNPTFAKDILDKLDHPFIKLLQSSRGIKTMVDTFIDGAQAKAVNGRIHTDFNQVKGDEYGTGTGRLSSSDPNLQQTPKRDGALAPLIRGLFVPDRSDYVWIRSDWSQFEFRFFAHYSQDRVLIKRYADNPALDFHQALSDMTGVVRDRAKRINLGLVFGMGEGKLAQELGLPYTREAKDGQIFLRAGAEAKALFDEYHEKFPGAKTFLTRASNLARSRGYVKTILGRKIRFPNGHTHKAGGLIFQGGAADIMKQKLVVLNDEFRNTSVEFILPVHDEFDFLGPHGYEEDIKDTILNIVQSVPELNVPVLAECGWGNSWWEASE